MCEVFRCERPLKKVLSSFMCMPVFYPLKKGRIQVSIQQYDCLGRAFMSCLGASISFPSSNMGIHHGKKEKACGTGTKRRKEISRNPSTLVRRKLPVKRARVKGDALEDIRALPIGEQGYTVVKGTHPPSSSRTYARKKTPNPHVCTHHSASYNPPTPPPSPPTISTPHASPPIQIPSPRMSPSIQPHHTPIHVPPIPIPPIPPPMLSPSSPAPTILVTPSSSHVHSTSTQPMHSSTPPLAPCSSTYALPALENIHIENLHARNMLESLSLLHDYP
ncbi:hypothetical protein KP509_35G039800 [Ceratopteris richardii]|uniref:Uncharacterized protein n=1 Tax=Ceratopteris richardii TaxID=49495 RepID=A0A8T2QG72_CERRI|nr:hypothetical protein KP509_35G039800 [Ceratopteris richardii]